MSGATLTRRAALALAGCALAVSAQAADTADVLSLGGAAVERTHGVRIETVQIGYPRIAPECKPCVDIGFTRPAQRHGRSLKNWQFL